MEQGKFGQTDEEDDTLQQGKYGEIKVSYKDKTWICPKCETINTEDQCILCGHQKHADKITGHNSGKRKILSVICSIFVLIIGISFLVPNGWRVIDGKYYYYNWGKKAVGETEIDGKCYFFDTEGIMCTGWIEVSGNTFYYGTDGRLVTGYRTIDDVEYYLSENGIAQVVKKNIATTRAGGNITFTLEDGRKTWGNYRILNNPAEQCTYLHVRIDVTRLDQGDSDGNWQLSVRDKSTQKAWIHIADFEVRKGKSDCFVTLEEPISFEAFTCTRTEKGDWSGKLKQEIVEMRYLK